MELKIDTAGYFIKYVNKNWAYSRSYANDQSTIPDNSLAWNINFKAFRTNDATNSSSACIQIPIGYLNLGDKVELEAEFKNVSGTKGKIALDVFPDTTYLNLTNIGTISSTSSDGQFEHLKVTFIVTTEGYGRANFGIFTADIGDFYVRNVKVKTNSIYQRNLIPFDDSSWGVIFDNDTKMFTKVFSISANSSTTIYMPSNFFTTFIMPPTIGGICPNSDYADYSATEDVKIGSYSIGSTIFTNFCNSKATQCVATWYGR